MFQKPDLARLLMFMGGASLSKVYHLIERFSEDIDLVLDWRVLGGETVLTCFHNNRQTNAVGIQTKSTITI
ncbi:MAG: nucleotidyl transferase AbiEii/AbiGii toxin family protein [Pseudomonadota bacterium]